MPDESQRFFDMLNQFKQLNLMERLSLIPHSEFAILKTVMDAERCGTTMLSVSEIARALRVSPPAVSRKLKSLREKGFIQTQTDELDRRNTYVSATNAGKAALEENFKLVCAFFNRVLSCLKPEEIHQFYFLFDKIYANMSLELSRMTDRKEKGLHV